MPTDREAAEAFAEKVAADYDKNKQETFNNWVSNPSIRFIISLIPPGDHKETLDVLLRSAHDAGFASGRASLGMNLMSAMIERKIKEGQ